jgi:threonine/homoserine/homoserine lactone efflux protein
MPIEVIADRAVVDDEQRPGVVGVWWIGMIGEPGVEHLSDAGNRGLPGLDRRLTRGWLHRRIVQDGPAQAVYVHLVEQLVALIGFSVVSSVTPGPNNILLWASGAEFGFRRTLRHVVGTALGIGAMALAVAAGLGVLLTTIPEVTLVMKVGGSLYCLYLAHQIAGASALQRGAIAKPLGLLQAAAFQVMNPKAWIFALGALTTFRPTGLSTMAGGTLVALTMMIVIIPTAALWAGGGRVLSPFLVNERTHRIVSLILAAVLAATVAYVWI